MGTQKYDRDNTVHVSLKLNKKTDSDIINLLDAVDNKQGFLKHIIRVYDGSTGVLHRVYDSNGALYRTSRTN